MKKIKKGLKGFTLVELLLVIAIIGILAAVLFVSLGKQRERARLTTFKENMRGLVTAATACKDAGTATVPTTIQNTQESPICDPASGIGEIPAFTNCIGGSLPAENLTITDPGSDTWEYTGTCEKSEGDDCVAVCDVNGCVFTDCE